MPLSSMHKHAGQLCSYSRIFRSGIIKLPIVYIFLIILVSGFTSLLYLFLVCNLQK